jgi:hypothetical protein
MGFVFVHLEPACFLEGVQHAYYFSFLSDQGHSHQHGIIHELLMGLQGHSFMWSYPFMSLVACLPLRVLPSPSTSRINKKVKEGPLT